jgi:hypothetical protein
MTLGAQLLEFKLMDPSERSLTAIFCTAVMAGLMLFYIMFITWFIYYNRSTFIVPEEKEKYGALVENIRFLENDYQFTQYPVMLVRRTLYAIIPVAFNGRPAF